MHYKISEVSVFILRNSMQKHRNPILQITEKCHLAILQRRAQKVIFLKILIYYVVDSLVKHSHSQVVVLDLRTKPEVLYFLK